MFQLQFTPRSDDTIQPYKWTYRLSLAHIEGWRDLATSRFWFRAHHTMPPSMPRQRHYTFVHIPDI